jgi:glutamyl-tRNA synthetase
MIDKVRVRFAPSPTGYLHIGGARTALYNYLVAKHYQGVFILRVEDTDQVRSTEESTKSIFESLQWLGITWDEGPYYQSERRHIYNEYAKKLLDEKKAVYQEDPAKGKAVVFKMPTGKQIVFNDLIHEAIKFESDLLGDIVLVKSDGFPTYNFACVIDDALMNITHIIRGDDHISNTPKQIVLYEALGRPSPQFAHIPLIMGEDGSRLSKRHGHTSVSEYRELGYLPEALFNFLSLLGWSPGDDTEIMDRDEIIKRFTIERVKDKPAQFNIKKLTWLNSHYLKHVSRERLYKLAIPYLSQAGCNISGFPEEKIIKLVDFYRERIRILSEITEATKFFFEDKIIYQMEARQKFIEPQESKEVLQEVYDGISTLQEFNEGSLETLLRRIAESKNLKFQDVAQPIRVALTGTTVSPGIFEVMELLGRQKVQERIKQML